MTVKYEKQGRVGIITINRPEAMNAIDPETQDKLVAAWNEFRADNSLWVAILTGAGEKAFSAGADLMKLVPKYTAMTPGERRDEDLYAPGFGVISRNFTCWKPIICAINGLALGGGTEMALACDLRVAAEHAMFGLTEVRWGIIPGAGGTQRLPRTIPVGKAMEMILLGERIDAQEALRLNLVNKVVPKQDLMPTCMQMAETICKRGPLAVRAAKEAILRGLSMSLEEGLKVESALSLWLLSTDDAKEGPMAFLQKREPNFQAR